MLRLSLGRELRRASPPASREFTAAQRQQIEELVAQRVAENQRVAHLTPAADPDAQRPG
ncbi:hypothetical protein GKZ68_16465 [Hymenobacter sp. BRD128]|uniref:hypothetical protein n=1 Tax=Hymenobacter sp. BRD128 TaxID=2675878 RepID=UPI0015630264|nr:hypothetical protein [Hymenobacter sp. BRD128]QKG58075.1 hypothetical protein GKZ68_16465 [Hymenobacter sp. BRD128]